MIKENYEGNEAAFTKEYKPLRELKILERFRRMHDKKISTLIHLEEWFYDENEKTISYIIPFFGSPISNENNL